MVRQRVRIRFCKQGDLRLIGHRDLMRTMERVFRRGGLALGMSNGFHPKPRMTFPLALAVGIEGTDELLEVELAEAYSRQTVLERIAGHLPPGLTLKAVELLPPGAKKARVHSVCYRVPIPVDRRSGLDKRVNRLMAGSSYLVHRPNRTAPVDLRADLMELALHDDSLTMRLRTGSQAAARPREVLEALGLADLELDGVHLSRTAVEINDETRNVDQRLATGGMPDCDR